MAGKGSGEKKQGLPDAHNLAEQVKDMVKKLGEEKSTNVASSLNVGGTGITSVSSKQRIVQRDGKTETITERTEHRSS